MSDLLRSIIKQFNDILYSDSAYFRELIIDPLLMSNTSFIALYKETIDKYNNDPGDFANQGFRTKCAIAFRCIVFATRKKSIDQGFSQLQFYSNIFQENMIINSKIFNEINIPHLSDFHIIGNDRVFCALLDPYTYKIGINSSPLYGEFAIAIHNKFAELEKQKTYYEQFKNYCALL